MPFYFHLFLAGSSHAKLWSGCWPIIWQRAFNCRCTNLFGHPPRAEFEHSLELEFLSIRIFAGDEKFRTMTGAQPKLWIVISRPDRLPTALAVAQALRAQFPGGVHLLREDSKWWERAHWRPYAGQFDEIHAFPRVNTCRGLRDLPRLYRESAERREAIAQLPIDKERDLIVCVGGILTISNATISAHPEATKVLCVAEKVYRDLTCVGERTRYRFTTSGWCQNRIVEPMAGLNRTLHFKPRINPGGDGVRVERLQKNPDSLYHRIVVMRNGGAGISKNPKKIWAKIFTGAASRGFPRGTGKNRDGVR